MYLAENALEIYDRSQGFLHIAEGIWDEWMNQYFTGAHPTYPIPDGKGDLILPNRSTSPHPVTRMFQNEMNMIVDNEKIKGQYIQLQNREKN